MCASLTEYDLGQCWRTVEQRPKHGQLRPCNAECPLSFRQSLETFCCDGKKGSQDTRRVVSRNAEGHLLRGEEDLGKCATQYGSLGVTDPVSGPVVLALK